MSIVDTSRSIIQPEPVSPPSEPPFSPGQSCLLGFFFGPITAGIVAGINWRRLGKPERFWLPTLLGIALVTAETVMLAATVVFHMAQDAFGIAIWISIIVSWLFAISVMESQRRDYNRWRATFGGTAQEQRTSWLLLVGIGVAGSVHR